MNMPCVSAQVSELRMTFAQKNVGGKSNKIPAVQNPLGKLDISSCIIVAGVINCRKIQQRLLHFGLTSPKEN